MKKITILTLLILLILSNYNVYATDYNKVGEELKQLDHRRYELVDLSNRKREPKIYWKSDSPIVL